MQDNKKKYIKKQAKDVTDTTENKKYTIRISLIHSEGGRRNNRDKNVVLNWFYSKHKSHLVHSNQAAYLVLITWAIFDKEKKMHCYDLDPSPPLSPIYFVNWIRGDEEAKKHSSASLFLPQKAANIIIFLIFFFNSPQMNTVS